MVRSGNTSDAACDYPAVPAGNAAGADRWDDRGGHGSGYDQTVPTDSAAVAGRGLDAGAPANQPDAAGSPGGMQGWRSECGAVHAGVSWGASSATGSANRVSRRASVMRTSSN